MRRKKYSIGHVGDVMAKIKKMTPKNLQKVLEEIPKLIAAGYLDAVMFCPAFNNWLDDMLGEDMFGTEGQNDPRGDHRE